MHIRLHQSCEAELRLGHDRLAVDDLEGAFRHFERAHILGQRSTRLHVRAHFAMLQIGYHRGSTREMFGQLLRIIAAALFSRIWVPQGNTGGSNVSAFQQMDIPEDLRRIMDAE